MTINGSTVNSLKAAVNQTEEKEFLCCSPPLTAAPPPPLTHNNKPLISQQLLIGLITFSVLLNDPLTAACSPINPILSSSHGHPGFQNKTPKLLQNTSLCS